MIEDIFEQIRIEQEQGIRNIYGCTKCPQCGGVHRVPYRHPKEHIACDDCGLSEPFDDSIRIYLSGE